MGHALTNRSKYYRANTLHFSDLLSQETITSLPQRRLISVSHKHCSTAGYFLQTGHSPLLKIAILSLKKAPLFVSLNNSPLGPQLLQTPARTRACLECAARRATTLRSKLSSRVYARSASIESVHDGKRSEAKRTGAKRHSECNERASAARSEQSERSTLIIAGAKRRVSAATRSFSGAKRSPKPNPKKGPKYN
jgi:hypothetical protein